MLASGHPGLEIKMLYYCTLYGYCCLVTKVCWAFFYQLDCSSPGSSIHGVSQARILEWVAISFSKDLPEPGIEPASPELAGGFFTTEPEGKPTLYSTVQLSTQQ